MMRFLVLLIIYFEFSYSITTTESLKEIQNNLSKNYQSEGAAKWGLHPDGSYSYSLLKKSFIDNAFQKFVGDEPIFVYEAASHTDSALGNRFGNYFEALACADVAGLHFISVSEQSDVNLFSKSFPSFKFHNKPVKDRNEGVNNVQRLCTNEKFPWESSTSLFYKNYYLVHDVMQDAVEVYLRNSYPEGLDAKVSNDTFSLIKYPSHYHEAEKNSTLPLIPSAAILFRCADIIISAGEDSGSYGFTKWKNYLNVIPQNSPLIYILTEPLDYMKSGNQAHNCAHIIGLLVDFLSHHLPNSLIAVRRGYPNDGLVVLSRASTIVCTASTFCLFPAFANTNGNIYLQSSNLFGEHKEVRIAPNIHWIPFSEQIYFADYNHHNGFVEHAVDSLKKGS